MSKLDYSNKIILNTQTPPISGNSSAQITVAAEIKLFKEKYAHQEAEEVMKGDDIGFTIVFGNYGELPWTQPTINTPTLEDELVIDPPISLKVMSLSLPCNYELWVVERDGVVLTNPRKLELCDVLAPGTYILQLRKLVNGAYTPYFDVPCHSIECFSMLFQIEFPACPSCGNDCKSLPIKNGDFELEPHNTEDVITDWSLTIPSGGQPFAKTTDTVTLTNPSTGYSQTYNPVNGGYFALLKTDGPDRPTSMSQTIEVCSGDTIEGYAFFFTKESNPTLRADNAKVEILDKDNNVIATPFNETAVNIPPENGSTVWEKWGYTFTAAGIYTIKCSVVNEQAAEDASYIGIDYIQIIK